MAPPSPRYLRTDPDPDALAQLLAEVAALRREIEQIRALLQGDGSYNKAGLVAKVDALKTDLDTLNTLKNKGLGVFAVLAVVGGLLLAWVSRRLDDLLKLIS